MTIYVDAPLTPDQKELLRSSAPDEAFVFRDELAGEEQYNALLKADVLLGNPRPVEWLKAARNLKWIQLYSTGFEYYSGIQLPAVVTNMRDYYSEPCAETMIAGIMALYRGMDALAVLKKEKQWVGPPIRQQLQLLHRKKVIILGTGNIGRRVAKILSGFDAEIIFFGRTAPDALLRSPEELLQKISWADIIIACLPGTDETRGLFTRDMISRMNKGALFCNVGRGNLLADEDALAEALASHTIGGAVLDVTAAEPLPAGSKLWNCPNTILSQHSGGGQLAEIEGILELFLENLKRYKSGQPLKNQVHFDRGY
ncbi:MAG: D-2-hydroxyacid dehydrogenase [Williamsia sp.]|nr:D-2-hydroxyacid dehydrogenase [Williamsia sp.]